jgi:hypothetical protein
MSTSSPRRVPSLARFREKVNLFGQLRKPDHSLARFRSQTLPAPDLGTEEHRLALLKWWWRAGGPLRLLLWRPPVRVGNGGEMWLVGGLGDAPLGGEQPRTTRTSTKPSRPVGVGGNALREWARGRAGRYDCVTDDALRSAR